MRSLTKHYAAASAADLRQSWRDLAACKKKAGLLADPARAQEATALCYRCPVLDDCRAWVMCLPQADDPDGITAGLTWQQRRRRRLAARSRKPPSPAQPVTGDLTCGDYGDTKPASEFHKDRTTPTGRTPYCRDCRNHRQRACRRTRKERSHA